MDDPLFYIVELDLPDEDLPGFLDWYAFVHAPHLYEAGFTLCTSYRAVSGAMSLVDIYQAPSPAVFESESFARYRKVFADDPYRPAYIGRNPNTRTPYGPVRWPGQERADPLRPLDADWITIRRFGADGDLLDRVAAWLGAGGAARLTAEGASHVRLLRKGQEAPTGPSIRPAGALVVEWSGPPGEIALPGWLAPAAAAHDGFEGRRLYPWPLDRTLKAG